MTTAEVRAELGDGWDVWTEDVSIGRWRDAEWRMRKLCEIIKLEGALAAYETRSDGSKVRLWIAQPV